MQRLLCSILIPLLVCAAANAAPPELRSDESFVDFRTRRNDWAGALPDEQRIIQELQAVLGRFSDDRFGRLGEETASWPGDVLSEARPWNAYWDDAQRVQGEFGDDLDRLSEIAKRPFFGAEIPLQYEPGVPIELPGMAVTEYGVDSAGLLRTAMKDLVGRGAYLAFTGDTDGAIERFRSAADLCDRALELPGTINWLTELAMRALLAESMVEMVEHEPDLFSDEQLGAMQRILIDDLRDDPAPVFMFNRFVTREDWRMLFHSLDLARTNAELRAYFQHAVKMGRAMPIADEPFVDLPDPESDTPLAPLRDQVSLQTRMLDAMLSDLDADPATQKTTAINLAIRARLGGEDANRFLPVFIDVQLWRQELGVVHRDRYRTTNLIVELAVFRHRLRHGDWPRSLDALDPETLPIPAMDLYSGEPLRYALVDGEPRLWALGADRDDDGGRPVRGDEYDLSISAANWFAIDEWEALGDEQRTRYDGDLVLLPR